MDRQIMESALNEARAALANISIKAARIKADMDALQGVVSGLEKILGSKGTSKDAMAGSAVTPKSDSTWRLAQKVLAEAQMPLTVPEIFSTLEKRGGVPPAKDAIRIAMMRKTDIFRNVEGKYHLVPELSTILEGIEKELEATEVAS